MATRRSSRVAHATARSPRFSVSTTTRKKRGPGVATLAPLALGLASGLLPSAQPPATRVGQSTAVVEPGKMFTPVCALPFAGAINRPADDHCPIQGGSQDPGKQAESRAKNNFCARMDSPVALTHQDLVNMQTASVQARLPKNLPDRSAVETLGEGKYASYIAFVEDAHYSDVANGEAVNCNIPGDSTNDIHIVLVEHPNDDECTSTTAEMSPHYRPAIWTPDAVNSTKTHPVRVRGQLFYDGSHTPCSGSSRPNPKRISLWEIHPVYSFDVCRLTDLAQCQSSTDPSDWMPLDQWAKQQGLLPGSENE